MTFVSPVRYRYRRSPSSSFEEGKAIKDSDFKFDLKRCEYFALKNMDEIEFDMLFVIAAVDYVDRIAKRKLSEGWERYFSIDIPVSNPSFWNTEKLKSSLENVLNLLTGDKWSFSFYSRVGLSGQQQMLPINKNEKFVILPYSDGLDSYALGCLLPEVIDGHRQIRVTSWNSALNGEDKNLCSDEFTRIAIPISTHIGKHPEESFRTRPFKFFLTAALVARKLGAGTIYIPENGQGTFGPSLVLKGGESAYLGTHPVFTNKLGIFIKTALGHDIKFDHPHMWRTKGQVVREMVDKGFSWKGTKSCPLDGRSLRHRRKGVIHCGICSSCILRRISLHAAGVKDEEEYYWDNTSNCDIKVNSDCQKFTHPSSHTYGMAFHAIESMERLANMLDSDIGIRAVKQQAFWLGAHLDQQDKFYEGGFRQLILAHKTEWQSFLKSLNKNSWLRSVAEGLR